MIDPRIKYWTQGWAEKNFGDYLTEWLYEDLLVAPLVDADRYRLLGSAIDDHLLAADLAECGVGEAARVVLWGCGKRDAKPLSDTVRAACHFFGVRGPLSRDGLGLPPDTPIGDPGLLLPLLYPRRGPVGAGPVLCVPHYNEPTDAETLRQRCGADELASARVASPEAMKALVDRIAGAQFVLAGSLHAAITACAYGVPFGYWDTGFVDCPFKWEDFAASLGVAIPFSKTVAEAREHHGRFAPGLRRPSATAILRCCPFGVRPGFLMQAAVADAAVGAAPQAASFDDAWVAQVRAADAERRRRTGQAHAAVPHAGQRRWAAVAPVLARCAATARAHLDSLDFRFAPEGPDLRFSAGCAGAAFLGSGWTEPNEVGPWAVERFATMRLPHETRWWAGPAFQMGMIAFAPHAEPFRGERRLVVRANDMVLGEFLLQNTGTETATYTSITIALPALLRDRGGELLLSFESDTLHSAAALGVGSDERNLSIAPTYLKHLLT